jgi:hypothetical protein
MADTGENVATIAARLAQMSDEEMMVWWQQRSWSEFARMVRSVAGSALRQDEIP